MHRWWLSIVVQAQASAVCVRVLRMQLRVKACRLTMLQGTIVSRNGQRTPAPLHGDGLQSPDDTKIYKRPAQRSTPESPLRSARPAHFGASNVDAIIYRGPMTLHSCILFHEWVCTIQEEREGKFSRNVSFGISFENKNCFFMN